MGVCCWVISNLVAIIGVIYNLMFERLYKYFFLFSKTLISFHFAGCRCCGFFLPLFCVLRITYEIVLPLLSNRQKDHLKFYVIVEECLRLN